MYKQSEREDEKPDFAPAHLMAVIESDLAQQEIKDSSRTSPTDPVGILTGIFGDIRIDQWDTALEYCLAKARHLQKRSGTVLSM